MANIDYNILGQINPYSAYAKANQQANLANELAILEAQQRQQQLNQGGTQNLPAALQLANEYQAAIDAGDINKANQIAAFAKIYPKGFQLGEGGALQPYEGYVAGERDISGAKSYGSTTGTQVATGTGELASMEAKLPNLQLVVNDLKNLADKATYTYAGRAADEIARQAGYTTEGAEARAAYMSKVRNQVLPLLRDTFGAAFTAAEGEKLEGTLGDPNLSPAEKQVALDSFIAQKVMDIQSKRSELQMRQDYDNGYNFSDDATNYDEFVNNLPKLELGNKRPTFKGESVSAPNVKKKLKYNPKTGEFE